MEDELHRADLGRLGARLGSGGQAVVYLVPDLRLPDAPSALVYKEYKGNQVAPHGLRAIVRVRSKMAPAERERLDTVAVWPVRVVRDEAGIRGVVMPLIPGSFFQDRMLPSGTADRHPREAQNLFVSEEVANRVGMPAVALGTRFAICRDAAGALSFLHQHGIVFGDINAKNELFRLAPEPTVMLVDCDAVRIRGSAAVVRQLNAPDWAPPEGGALTQATDVYKLGLFVLRTLGPGPQASVSRDPRRATPLDRDGMVLLQATLSPSARTRPTAAAWFDYLRLRTPSRRTPDQIVRSAVPVPAPATQRTSGWRRDPRTGTWVPAS
jgi:serine/threonine protein kinase